MKKKLQLISKILFGNKMKGLTTGLFFLSITANSQNIWTQKTAPSTPFAARNACAGFSIGNKGYFGTGTSALGEIADWYEYNPTTDTWTQKASFAGGVREAMVSFSIGSKGYVGLGDIGGTTTFADFWEYDPATDVWTKKADFPGGARTTAVGFSSGTKGYVGCGDAVPGFKNDFYEYDPTNNTWTQKANFAGTARSDANAFFIGTKGYIGVGDDGSLTFKKDFWEYDPALNTWTAKANFGGGNRSTATAFALNGKGYIGAGDNGTALKKDFWEWDPTSNIWTLTTSFLGVSRSDMLGFTIGNKAYAGNGNTCGASCYINDWYEFSTLTTSIDNKDKQQVEFSVYPNPTNGNINIRCETLNDTQLTFAIYDVLGKKVATSELSRIEKTNTINVSTLNDGIYYYQVLRDGKSIRADKLIITK